MDLLLRVLVFAAGLVLVIYVSLSAVRTFVLPRASPEFLSRLLFLAIRFFFDLRAKKARSYEERDQIMALYAPISLILLIPFWLTLILIGYMGMFWAIGVRPWSAAFLASGSALFTLGFVPATDLPTGFLEFSEATIGLILVALLIAYLPTMYSAFSRREAAVALLEVRAGTPPSAVEMILRFQRIHGLDRLTPQWTAWENWFVELDESHTSLAALVFFRSPQPQHSWITAAGTVLDAAALVDSTIDVPREAEAQLCLRAGYIALRRIADFFDIPYNPNPQPGDPISISRDEFDAVYDRLAEEGVPLKPDRDEAWRNFAGWRVNYDAVLLALARLIMAPYAPWSSDRSLPFRRGLFRRRRR
ncbi:MAG: hypothetical protein DPW09_21955 [Anaerolineae bacterium]|nr:hypothetical protein [Anaerolineales bacterium]MCQ3976101.1 hypothetical protein [Anaerolineae bacterium]